MNHEQASLRIFAEADEVTRLLAKEIKLQVIFALKNCQTYVYHSKKLPIVRKTNNPQFPVPKVPGEAPTLHAMIPYDVRGQKSKRN